jgi:Phosphodiester glycosidase
VSVRLSRAWGCVAGLWVASFSGCALHPAAADPVSWTTVAPGLETAIIALSGSRRLQTVRFDQVRYQLRLLSPPGGLRVPEDAPPDAVAIWNGGYFEHDLRPSGLVIEQGRQVAAPSRGSGLALLGERLSLLRYRETEVAGPHESALQLWPFLIEPGGADGIRRDDGKRARRSALALDDAGRGMLLSVVGDGISLFELMGLCRKLGAVVALNLDGGPSTGFALLSSASWRESAQTSVANALILVER